MAGDACHHRDIVALLNQVLHDFHSARGRAHRFRCKVLMQYENLHNIGMESPQPSAWQVKYTVKSLP